MAKEPANGRRLYEVIGENLRRWREDTGRTQDEVAALAREVGLQWKQTTITQIETGRRETLERLSELVLVSEFTGLSLSDLVDGGSPVQLTDAASSESHWLAEKLLGKDGRGLKTPADLIHGGLEFLEREYPGQPKWKLAKVATDAQRTAEKRAAATLGTDPLHLSIDAWKIWDRGLTEERDRRARAEYPDGANAQALGRITRKLLAELRGDTSS